MSSRLPRQAKLFGAVSLLNDFASEMIYPLLPAFVTGVLGAGPQALGALDGAAEFAAAFVKLGSGRLADRPARRGPLVVVGYFIAVVVRPIIADVTPAELRGRAFGLQRGMDHAGAVLGPLVAWYLLASQRADVRAVIGWSRAPGVLVLMLAIWAVRDGGGRGGTRRDGERVVVPSPSSPVLPRLFPSGPLVAISLFYLLRMPDTLIILRSQELC